MYYAQQKVDRGIKSLSATSYDTLPPEPEIHVAASTSQEAAKLPSKPDPKEAKGKKRSRKGKDAKGIKEERTNENCLKLNLNGTKGNNLRANQIANLVKEKFNRKLSEVSKYISSI